MSIWGATATPRKEMPEQPSGKRRRARFVVTGGDDEYEDRLTGRKHYDLNNLKLLSGFYLPRARA